MDTEKEQAAGSEPGQPMEPPSTDLHVRRYQPVLGGRGVTVARLSQNVDNPLELQATQQIIRGLATPDGYKCPHCQFATNDADEMVAHLADEINDLPGIMQRRLDQCKPPQGIRQVKSQSKPKGVH